MRCVHPGKKRFDLVEPTRAGSRRLTSQTTCQGLPPRTGLRTCKQKRERERCVPFPVSWLGLRGACHPEEAFTSCFFFWWEGKRKRRIVSVDVLFTLEVMRPPMAASRTALARGCSSSAGIATMLSMLIWSARETSRCACCSSGKTG